MLLLHEQMNDTRLKMLVAEEKHFFFMMMTHAAFVRNNMSNKGTNIDSDFIPPILLDITRCLSIAIINKGMNREGKKRIDTSKHDRKYRSNKFWKDFVSGSTLFQPHMRDLLNDENRSFTLVSS